MPGLGSGRIWSLAIEPSRPSTILAGTDLGIYVSRDTGATWTQTLAGFRVWTIGFDARNPSEAFAGTDGKGVYASADSGTTWADASSGLGNLDVRALAFGFDGIAAGTNAGVALSPNGHIWHDGGLDRYSISAVAVAANHPQFSVIAGADGAISGTLASGYLFGSTGGGAWEVLQSGLPAGAVVSSITAGQIDAAVPKRPVIVTTSQGIFRSGDGGITWTAGTGVPQALTLTVAQFGPLDPNLAYAGADAGGSTGGDFYRSTDGGLTYHKADTGLPSGRRNVEAIAIANTTPPEVVVAVNPPTGGSQIYIESDSTAPGTAAAGRRGVGSRGAVVGAHAIRHGDAGAPGGQTGGDATGFQRHPALRGSRLPLADPAGLRGLLRAPGAVRLHPVAAALLRRRTALALADLR